MAAGGARLEFLAAIGRDLSGQGIEFGAGGNPFPIGAACRIRYADRNSGAQLRERNYFGESPIVESDLLADFETMEGLEFESLDFIIASHVIEHTPNPLRALESAYLRLRRGGRLVLVVPDKTVTFDRDRALTPLDHVILDYTHPSRERDWPHYVEFFAKAFPQPDPARAAEYPYRQGDDIHYHVWTYESFGEFIEYVRREMRAWTSVWSHPRLSEQDIEFYFVLTK